MILKLHAADDNSVVLVHDEDVLTYREKNGKTRVRFKDYNFDTLIVNESPDKILAMMQKTE